MIYDLTMVNQHASLNQVTEFVSETTLPTTSGPVVIRAYRSSNGIEPLAIFCHYNKDEMVNVRIHDACFTSEVLGSLKCDCKDQFDYALNYTKQHGGLIIYLQQEGRGIGLANKIAAYALQEKGMDTVDANRALNLPDDARNYAEAIAILKDLKISRVALLTNNPRKIKALQKGGITVEKRLPIFCASSKEASKYLQDKIKRMGHLLPTTETD